MFTFFGPQRLRLSPAPGIELQLSLRALNQSLLFSCHLWCLCDCSECPFTLPRLSLGTSPGTALPPPFMGSFSVARCPPSPWLLRPGSCLGEEPVWNSRPPLPGASEKGNRQVMVVRGMRDAHQKRGCGGSDDGTDGHRHSGVLGTVFYRTIPIFTSRKRAFGGDFCPSLYFYNPHVQWNIKC